ncbi:MAG: Bax inhibitor-1/YccA family protein [Clostridia bacterium]|nr:Bax inhibitor-1/YccA family protein [Clostridia bacterium]
MALGLTLTFVFAILTAWFAPALILSFPLAMILLIAQVITVVSFSNMLHRAKFGTVLAMFIAYSILTGISISYVFVLYDLSNIFLCFAAAALCFAILAILGHSTRRDLSSLGRYFLVGLIGLLLLTLVGYFIHSTGFEILICCIGLVLFLGITAYDTQRLRQFAEQHGEGDEEMAQKVSIYFAMQLYLDFINIFLYIIRLFGRQRR